jgi:geranylgeranyl reductase family protein
MDSCDVLVVGLGPAGGAAALAAAEAGLRVIALERRNEIGRPVQCAECVPAAMGRLVRRTGCEVQRVEAMQTVLPSGASVDSPFRGIMIDRAKLDAGLARSAEAAGAKLLTGWRFEALDAVGGRVRCRSAQGMREISYRLLIAADGPFSPVAAALGLASQPVALARQITVPLLQPLARTEVYLSPDYLGGYGWLFPKGGVANLGVGVVREAGHVLRERLHDLHRRLSGEGRVGSAILARTGGAIPVGGLRLKPAVGNVMFAGDAAGLTHPVTGAGIHPAVTSGEAAGQAAARWLAGDGTALEGYEAGMAELFGPSLARALHRRGDLKGGEGDEGALRRGWVAFPDYYRLDEVQA